MKDKYHFYTSLAKSAIRIIGCFWGIISQRFESVLVMLILAELLGIFEEVFDKRG